METEYKTLIKNETWILVPRPTNKKILSNRWVFRVKKTQEGKIDRYKARLVIRGCIQEAGVDYDEVFAPVVRYETIRSLLACAVNEEMYVHQMDVVSAYVQGNLHDEIYMEQPELFIREDNENKVCLLKKPFYGLKQAGREWYKRLNDYLTKIGAKNNSSDPCVYIYGDDKEDTVILLIYVDDLMLASKNINKLMELKTKLKTEFRMTDLGPLSQILGINVIREEATGRIQLNQREYIKELISRFKMDESKTVSTPCAVSQKLMEKDKSSTEEEIKNNPYRELVGSLIHLANATRPDIAYIANVLSRFLSNPRRKHWIAAKRVRYLKGTIEHSIVYGKDESKAQIYVDSDWAGDVSDRRSC